MHHGITPGPIATFIAFPVGAGSRSSALTLAVAMHPRARVMTCIDERSLGFWVVGHARATG
jgi:2-succinyl-5-enolpyruvyl-6-hydroxy-3-cyclohexene-1-carboxylate synthase